MKDRLYATMARHTDALFGSEELTMLKVQIGDLMESIEAKEPLDILIMHLNDITASMSIIENRLDIVREITEVLNVD